MMLGEGVNKLGSTGSSVMVFRKVGIGLAVRVGVGGVTEGSYVGRISVGPSVLTANGSRVEVGEGKRVTVGCGVNVGSGVDGVRKDRSSGSAEQAVMSTVRNNVTIFFMISSEEWHTQFYTLQNRGHYINCILFDGD